MATSDLAVRSVFVRFPEKQVGWLVRAAAILLVLSAGVHEVAASNVPPADPRLEEADRVLRRGEYVRATALANAVLGDARARADAPLEVSARLTLADVFYYQGQLDAFRRQGERALALARSAGDTHGTARSLYSLAYFYERTAPARMLAQLSEARVHAAAAGDPALLMRIHNATGAAAWGLGRYAVAHEQFSVARDLARRRQDENNEGVALANLGLVEQARGDFESAQRLLEDALPLLEQHGNDRVGANVLATLAEGRAALGDLEGSLALREQALAIWRRVDHKRGEALVLQGIAGVERDLGRLARAESLLEEALALAVGLDDARRTVLLLMDLGGLLIEQGRVERAETQLRDALAQATASGDPLLEARASLALAGLETAGRRHAEALALVDHARQLAAGLGERWTEGLAWADSAAALEALGREADARNAWDRAVSLHEAIGARRWLHVWNGRLARLLARDGDAEQAEARWRRSLDHTDALETLLALDRFRLGLSREVVDVSHAYAGWLAGRGETARAWQVLDQGRARELRLRIAQAGATTTLGAGERDALARLSELQRRLSEASARAARDALTLQIEEAEAIYERARRDAAVTAPAARRRDGLEAPPLAAGELRVQYAVDGERVIVLSRRDRGTAVRLVPDAPGLLRSARRLREAAAARTGAFDGEREARTLYDALLGPELASGDITRLVLMPDAALHGLPFPALRTPDGAWLIERVVIVHAPSETTLSALRARSADVEAPRPHVLSIAATQARGAGAGAWSLPAVERGARAVARGVGSRALVDPDEAAVKGLPFGEYGVVHFAAHAQVDERHPERSGVVLAPGAHDDGLLQAREIYRLSLPVGMVVVSSCRSGAGAQVPSEGLAGLPHAFLASGARSVVSTLWDVTDVGSAEVMSAFYDELVDQPLAEALAAAQRQLIRSGRWSDPIHWAGYVLHGDGEQRISVARRRVPGLSVGLSVVVLVVGAGFTLAWRRRGARRRST